MLAQRGDDVSVLDFGNILSIGDSIDRKVISALTDELGQEMDYYTPMKYKTLPSGKVKPEQTGKVPPTSPSLGW